MGSNRVDIVVYDIIKAIRELIDRHDVTHQEYLKAQQFMLSFLSAKEYEIPLMLDIFFDATIHDVEMKHRKGSVTNTQGPYFKPDCPTVTHELKTLADKAGEAILLEGAVTDLSGKPIKGAEMFVWHSDPEGSYSGFCDYMPKSDYYRGRVEIPADGKYSLRTTMPHAYTIPHDGPTGVLLKAMGRHPWRPAHVHYIINADGFHQHVTQVYFAGDKYNDTDCAESVRPDLVHRFEVGDGQKVLVKNFILPPAQYQAR
jgi:chlorocatechol 1,2-dioxygenase